MQWKGWEEGGNGGVEEKGRWECMRRERRKKEGWVEGGREEESDVGG